MNIVISHEPLDFSPGSVSVGGGPNAKIEIHKENDELYNKYLSECIGIAKYENIILSIRQLF